MAALLALLWPTGMVMSWPLDRVIRSGEPVTAWLTKMSFNDAAVSASLPLKTFMIKQTRESDLKLFADMSDAGEIAEPASTPFTILVPAFVTSELKTGFQIGFLIFLPFLIIDLVVASVLMSMGMMMLSPVIISLPFKLMLFVVVDGWNLLIGSLVRSFQP